MIKPGTVSSLFSTSAVVAFRNSIGTSCPHCYKLQQSHTFNDTCDLLLNSFVTS